MVDLEMAVYVDQHIYDHYGYKPADVISTYFGDALNYAGINSWSVVTKTDIPFDGRDVPDDYDDGGKTYDIWYYFKDWLQDDNDYEDNPDGYIYNTKDCFHLCFDEAQIGGAGGLGGGNVSVAPASNIDHLSAYSPPRYIDQDSKTENVLAAIQEAGHALGLCPNTDHDCGLHYTADNYYADSVPDESDDTVYSTPMGAQRTSVNSECEYYGTNPDNYSKEYTDARYFDWCAGDLLRSEYN